MLAINMCLLNSEILRPRDLRNLETQGPPGFSVPSAARAAQGFINHIP